MYWAYRNFKVCVIWAYVVPGFFPKLVGEFVVYLVFGCPFVYVCEFGLCYSQFLVPMVFVDVCRFRTALVCVHVGTPLSLYDAIWAICIMGVSVCCLGGLPHLLIDMLFHCLLCLCVL